MLTRCKYIALHLFLSVGEHEVVDEEAQWEQIGQGGETKSCQKFQTTNKIIRFCRPELEFVGEVFLGLPHVTTEYQEGNILNSSHWIITIKYRYQHQPWSRGGWYRGTRKIQFCRGERRDWGQRRKISGRGWRRSRGRYLDRLNVKEILKFWPIFTCSGIHTKRIKHLLDNLRMEEP